MTLTTVFLLALAAGFVTLGHHLYKSLDLGKK